MRLRLIQGLGANIYPLEAFRVFFIAAGQVGALAHHWSRKKTETTFTAVLLQGADAVLRVRTMP